jgi:hypothetical protein
MTIKTDLDIINTFGICPIFVRYRFCILIPYSNINTNSITDTDSGNCGKNPLIATREIHSTIFTRR